MLAEGAAAAILGGWQLSGVLQLQSGFPYTIDYKGDPINIGGGSGGILVRPELCAGAERRTVDPNLPSGQRSTARMVQHRGFRAAGLFVRKRGAQHHDRRRSLATWTPPSPELSPDREGAMLQFRAEFFNLANHPNYNLIGRIVNDPTFGIVQNQLPPRQIQFGVKLGF